MRWMDSIDGARPRSRRASDRRQFLLNLICFAACIEGLFFFAAFAYVYFLRSRGLLHGLAAGTNWVFRDESAHMAFAFEVVETVRARGAGALRRRARAATSTTMIDEAVDCETQFAEDLLARRRRRPVGRATCASTSSSAPTSAWRRWACRRATARRTRSRFMDLQDVQELTNFFERRVSAYQVGVTGEVSLDAAF